ncbi:hypothetical protein KPL37_06430 [Clostridium frigoris]|uniref:HNH nuclease domain-containing protein n=1 Tax=Clostridium frigoris TaxID=205327 RepID=A0ABS6BSP8_9CLOT|nr:hypothetical protein [Clostridium frigoris]
MTFLKILKKDGTTIDCKIDTEDLQRVLEKGRWFAEWNKDFNNFLAQNLGTYYIEEKKYRRKQSLQSFILNVHPKAPVRHINGDTLDNRKSNLEVYDQNTMNSYEGIDEESVAVILRDRYGKEKARTIIDKEDLNRVINNGCTWVLFKKDTEPYAVANTPEGKIYLNRFIMSTTEDMITHPINLNTLDNRKANLENKNANVENVENAVSEETEN